MWSALGTKQCLLFAAHASVRALVWVACDRHTYHVLRFCSVLDECRYWRIMFSMTTFSALRFLPVQWSLLERFECTPLTRTLVATTAPWWQLLP